MASDVCALTGYAAWESRNGVSADAWCPVILSFDAAAKEVVERFESEETLVVPSCEKARLGAEQSADNAKKLTGFEAPLLIVFVQQSALCAVLGSLSAKVLSVGAPFAAPGGFDGGQPVTDPPEAEAIGPAKGPLVGIIDDGIAWANARFCRLGTDALKTRFTAVWLQSEAVRSKAGSVPVGHVLTAPVIDAHLASGRAEADLYRDLNRVLYPPPAQAATNTAAAHGTHVLDLAAGEDPATGGGPLIAVQLPATMMADTSGRKMEPFLVLGLRWIVTQALGLDRDLVVNISLGTLAGPGDATHPVARAISHEIARFTALTQKRMRVVIAYGNSWRDNLVGEMELGDPWPNTRAVDWRILPDDYSSSFLELRIPKGRTGEVALTLEPPVGKERTWTWANREQPPEPLWFSGNTAAILPLPDETDCHALLLAVAPTAGEGPLALAGAWRLTATLSEKAEPCSVTLRVQRTDTPVGYRVFGRQSYLADAKTGEWDDDTRDYTFPNGDSVIRRAGTANAYAGAAEIMDRQGGSSIYYIGALRPDPREENALRPSRYSSEGARPLGKPQQQSDGWMDIALNPLSKGPTASAPGDDGMFFPGRRATGVFSGARTLRLAGTSMAAGVATRTIVEDLRPGSTARSGAQAPVRLFGDSRTGGQKMAIHGTDRL